MRLWHETLLPLLDNQRILGQHRECCALRGKGWGKKNMVVNYVFNHTKFELEQYHYKVMQEMDKRGFKYDDKWKVNKVIDGIVYEEHDDIYLTECLLNLERKGVDMIERFKDVIKPITDSIIYSYNINAYRGCTTQDEVKVSQKRFYKWEK